MSSRASRTAAVFNPISLPFASTPQYVNDEGFERDPLEDLLVNDEGETAEADVDAEHDVIDGVEDVNEEIEVDGDMESEEDAELDEEMGEDIEAEQEETQESLLSIEESLVLPYSLIQTRNHHLTSLFPHIFTHPSIPSHSKPKPRPLPKGKFLFPTPALFVPLPGKEYHGPLKATETSSDHPAGESSKTSNGEQSNPSSPAIPGKTSRPPKPKKPLNPDEIEPPAHEIECISRCTVSIGPISFPGAEIWIGRFVEPRLTQPKKERAKPGERAKRLKTLAEEAAVRRAKRAAELAEMKANATPGPPPARKSNHGQKSKARSLAPTPGPSTPQVRPTMPAPGTRPPQPLSNAGPSNYRPPPGQAAPGTPYRPRPGPAGPGVPPARPTASPQLIQLVNQAASRAPWLSALIYKAAGSTANQEELERLGKAVARLSRGEPIADLAPPGTPAGMSGGPGPTGSPQIRSPVPLAPANTRPGMMTPFVRPQASTPAPVEPNQSFTTAPAPPANASPISQPVPVIKPAESSSSDPPPHLASTMTTTMAAEQASSAPAPATATINNESDSDDEVDMTGPKQVGGGPLPPASDQAVTVEGSEADQGATVMDLQVARQGPAIAEPENQTVVQETSNPPPTASVAVTDTVPPVAHIRADRITPSSSAASQALEVPVPAVQPAPDLPFTSSTSTGNLQQFPSQPSGPNHPPTHTSPHLQQSIMTPSPRTMSPTPPPPPPPKPSYPLPPPFMLIAFKEQPTEKFLIPLGKGSFISRVGGDYVTSSPPPPTPVKQDSLPLDSTPKEEVPCNISNGAEESNTSSRPIVNDTEVSVSKPPISINKDTKPLRSRTRQSLGRGAKELPPPPSVITPPPIPEDEPMPEMPIPEEPKVMPRPTSGLPTLTGTAPSSGTVLISTIVPSGESKWEKVDWEQLGKRLPFENPELWDQPNSSAPVVKQEPAESVSKSPTTPVRGTRHLRVPSANAKASSPAKPSFLNLAAENFIPTTGPVRPLTIRLSEVDDLIWQKIKGIINEVERAEIERLAQEAPELIADLQEAGLGQEAGVQSSGADESAIATASPSIITMGAVSPAAPGTTPAPVPVSTGGAENQTPVVPEAQAPATSPSHPEKRRGLSDAIIAALRPEYTSRKKSFFTSLLSRVPVRSFLKTRLPPPPPAELVEATTDKWAPRPYPLSTKPLYVVDANDGDDEAVNREIEFSPEPAKGNKKRKLNEEEDTVMFEMPVSLDSLDERVEEGAKRGIGRRGRGGRMSYSHARTSLSASAAGTGEDVVEGKKGRKGKRGTEKGTCEGCAREGIKVWRRGPGGRGTLCNACGDLFVNGQLGKLKAPGAMKAFLGEDAADEDDAPEEKQEGKEVNPSENTDFKEASSGPSAHHADIVMDMNGVQVEATGDTVALDNSKEDTLTIVVDNDQPASIQQANNLPPPPIQVDPRSQTGTPLEQSPATSPLNRVSFDEPISNQSAPSAPSPTGEEQEAKAATVDGNGGVNPAPNGSGESKVAPDAIASAEGE